MARRSPISRLKSVDLPTFGRPTIATIGLWHSYYLDFGSGSRRCRARNPGASRHFATYQKDRPPLAGSAGSIRERFSDVQAIGRSHDFDESIDAVAVTFSSVAQTSSAVARANRRHRPRS